MTRIFEDAHDIFVDAYTGHENKWSLCEPVGMSYWDGIEVHAGLARGSDTMLLEALKDKHYDQKAILDTGLCCEQPDGSVKDTIQNSLVFPLYDLQGDMAALLSYDLSAGQWTKTAIPGSDPVLRSTWEKKPEFLVLCETQLQCLRLGAGGILNTAWSEAEVCDTPENAAFWKSFDGPVILFSHDQAWLQTAAGVLGSYGVPVYNASDYLTRQQMEALENVDQEGFGDYLTAGPVFLWCAPETKQIKIPDGVEVISSAAFLACDDMEKIVVPDGVKKFNVRLWSADGLKELHIPASVTQINPFILNREAKCAVHTTKGSAAERFAKLAHQKLVIRVRRK